MLNREKPNRRCIAIIRGQNPAAEAVTDLEPGRPSSSVGMLPLQGGAGRSVRLLPAAVSPSQADTAS